MISWMLVLASASYFLFVMLNKVPNFRGCNTNWLVAIEFAKHNIIIEFDSFFHSNNVIVDSMLELPELSFLVRA